MVFPRGSLSFFGQIALVTGASRGFGAEIAKSIAAAGAHVVLVARSVPDLERVDDAIRAAGGTATLMPLDLSKLDDIAQLGPTLFNRFGRLDIFVHCAAMLGHLGPVAHFDGKIWDKVIALNLTAPHRLIGTLDPLLRASPHGRAVFVTDGWIADLPAYGGAYAASKTALEKMIGLYAAETAKTALRVSLADPGPMRTNLRAQAFPGENVEALPLPQTAAAKFMALLAQEPVPADIQL